MLKNSFTFFVFAFLTILCVRPVSAGGQLFDLTADTNGWKSDIGYGRNVRVFINPSFPCKGTELTFKFIDPKDGDYIATGDGNTGTYVLKDDGINGCSTYAKMASKNSETRQITVTGKNGDRVWEAPNAPVILVDFDGQYHAGNAYNGYNYRSSTENPYGSSINAVPTTLPVPSGSITVSVLSQERVAPYSRKVVIKWSSLDGNSIFYDIYATPSDEKNWEQLLSDQGGPSATLDIRADKDYFVKVQGCIRKVGNCVDSNVLFVPKTQNDDRTVITPKPIQSISTGPTNDTGQIEELNKKVSQLEGKLEESNKNQSALEQRINELVAFIKRLFPFFQ